ncbi:MAG TPA: helix-turn-helix domain-containing protein [Cytophagales bacterium]|nr:helix-turn-helix domain-containing protein [Cytophagales bacterium]
MKPTGSTVNSVPITIGEHIRKKRFERGLLQKDVAELIGVSEDSVTYWENNRATPQMHHMPKIIKFLDYIPISVDSSTLGARILLYRYQNGLSHKNLGILLGVNASTVCCWERNLRKPNRNIIARLDLILRS